MRIVLLLIAAAVLGLTLTRWLGEPPTTMRLPPDAAESAAASAVPTRPQDLKQFEQDLDRFLQDAATQRGRQADPP
jgi:hypothetical protein